MTTTPLAYQAPDGHRGLIVDEHPDGGVTITVPTRRGTFFGVLSSLADAHLLAVVAAPVVWLLFKLLASRTPRAVIRLTAEEFVLTETSDDGLGHKATVITWPRASIGELRPNRYANGLYFVVPGKVNTDLLGDLPTQTINAIGAALAAAQSRLDSRCGSGN
jgi:hypothetical protein